MERLEFHILQDGTVEEIVSGVKGTGCLNLTENIEEALGVVQYRKEKIEYYEQKDVTFQYNKNQDQIQTTTD